MSVDYMRGSTNVERAVKKSATCLCERTDSGLCKLQFHLIFEVEDIILLDKLA